MSEENKNYKPCKLDMNKVVKTALLSGAFACSFAGAYFVQKWNESIKGKQKIEVISKNQAERTEDNPYPFLSVLTLGGAVACVRRLSKDETGKSSFNNFKNNTRIALNHNYKSGAEL